MWTRRGWKTQTPFSLITKREYSFCDLRVEFKGKRDTMIIVRVLISWHQFPVRNIIFWSKLRWVNCLWFATNHYEKSFFAVTSLKLFRIFEERKVEEAAHLPLLEGWKDVEEWLVSICAEVNGKPDVLSNNSCSIIQDVFETFHGGLNVN